MRILSHQEFLKTTAGADAQKELQLMVKSLRYNTNGVRYAKVATGAAFVSRHLDYLVKHPDVSPTAYLSNLRIMTKLKR